jgi:hypothetical protein
MGLFHYRYKKPPETVEEWEAYMKSVLGLMRFLGFFAGLAVLGVALFFHGFSFAQRVQQGTAAAILLGSVWFSGWYPAFHARLNSHPKAPNHQKPDVRR